MPPTNPAPAPLSFVTARDLQVDTLPWGPHEWLCRPGLTAADDLQLVRVRMPAGAGHAFHRHPEFEEIIYVVDGRAEQWVGTVCRVLEAGEVAHIPRDVVHATYNADAAPLVFLAILSPARCTGPALIDVSHEAPWNTMRPSEG